MLLFEWKESGNLIHFFFDLEKLTTYEHGVAEYRDLACVFGFVASSVGRRWRLTMEDIEAIFVYLSLSIY